MKRKRTQDEHERGRSSVFINERWQQQSGILFGRLLEQLLRRTWVWLGQKSVWELEQEENPRENRVHEAREKTETGQDSEPIGPGRWATSILRRVYWCGQTSESS